MTPQQIFSLQRDKAAQILRRVMPNPVALRVAEPNCGEGGCYGGDVAYDSNGRSYRAALLNAKEAYDPETASNYLTGNLGWSTIISVGDYGPPGDTVWGRFEALYYADGTLSDVRFVKMERSGSWFEENLDTIGPLAVRLVAMAAGAGFLPTPADTTGAQMFDFFDAPSDFNLPVNVPADLPFDVPDFSIEDFSMPGYDYIPGEEVWTSSDLFPPDPTPYVPGEEIYTTPDVVAPDPTPYVPGEETWNPASNGDGGVTPPQPAPPPNTEFAPSPSTVPNINEAIKGFNVQMRDVLQTLSQAKSLISVFQNPQTRRVDGSTRTVRSDGTVLVRDASGRTSIQRPAVGYGEMATDGSVIINNGNGTYTRVSPDGRQQTLKYPSNLSMIGSQASTAQMMPLLLAGGAALFFLMRKR